MSKAVRDAADCAAAATTETTSLSQEQQHDHHEDKERRRKKQSKRMEKILAFAWELDTNACFQDDKKQPADLSVVLCLTALGQKLDQGMYKLGRHGWEAFARDLGGVYNRHAAKKTKRTAAAKEQFEKVKELLKARNSSLVKIASEYIPPAVSVVNNSNGSNDKKRKASDSDVSNNGKNDETVSRPNKKKANKNSDLAEREDRALDLLSDFVQERGGSPSLLSGFSARVTKKRSGSSGGGHNHTANNGSGNSRFDVNYYNEKGRRFRSMPEVGRFFKLVKDNERGGHRAGSVRRTAGSGDLESEKKRLRKELDRLRKAHQRATKVLDDFIIEEKESRYPIDDYLLQNEREGEIASTSKSFPAAVTCAAARIKDIVGFPGVPEHCIPDIIMAWDFLCTFQRALSLSPIALDDFACALTYIPPEGQIGDDVGAPPVYVAEAHLALIKLLLQDDYSNDWWWSTLETEEVQSSANVDETLEKSKEGKPAIRIDLAALLSEKEDPLITNSWLTALSNVCSVESMDSNSIKNGVKTALKLVANKWVYAYIKTVLDGFKSQDLKFVKQSLIFLVRSVREARPELGGRPVRQEALQKAMSKVIEDSRKAMDELSLSAPEVKAEDVHSDIEYDEESDESDDDGETYPAVKAEDPFSTARTHSISIDDSTRAASAIPPRPPPCLVDLLLPPTKPHYSAEFINSFTWTHIIGATAKRILHRKKRLWNEVDDYLRSAREMCPITLFERREREKVIASRVLTECAQNIGNSSPTEKAIDLLTSGGHYLQLTTVERLCILRLLIEAAYDAGRLYDVVNGNIKQRTSAMKALEMEQRKAKREAKDKALSDESAAREQLAIEARDRFLEEKREEIRKLNEKSKALTDDVMDSLTDEDILAFDDDIKADYDALPTSDSFNKTQVKEMVERMREEAAFDTDSLRIVTMNELLEREKRQLEEMEGQLLGFGGEHALLDPNLDRETVRSVERLQRDISKAKEQLEKLPELRMRAVEQLQESIADGTLKVLRSAITAAKKAKLTGPDDETGGVWALDLMRDAALEFESAKQNKRVLDAQRDLVTKMNKCFIRTEPMGRDRCGNRFWTFDNDDDNHVWVETEFLLSDEVGSSVKPPPGFLDLKRDRFDILAGEPDPMELDLMSDLEINNAAFFMFSRREYHSSGFTSSIVKKHWGCHASEDSLRAVIRSLDSKGRRENDLKSRLKEALEESIGSSDKIDNLKEHPALPAVEVTTETGESADLDCHQLKTSGDEESFFEGKTTALRNVSTGIKSSDDIIPEAFESLTTGIGQHVRVRLAVEEAHDKPIARYESGTVNGWKIQTKELNVQTSADAMDESDDEGLEPKTEVVNVPIWRGVTDRGHIVWLTATELIESICRYYRLKNGRGYFENDSAFIAYRNVLGRFCGKASEAPYSCSPNYFARLMVKREGELYAKLKIRSYDNNWGGKSGARALWMNSMKDYAYDFQTVKQGLLTLEDAFFGLTGKFTDYPNDKDEFPDVKAILDNPLARDDIELETEKTAQGLWNSPKSRAVFIEIVSTCKTTGILALALDLLGRNTSKYLQTHKHLNHKASKLLSEESEPIASRRTRRMNAWQQKQEVNYAESDPEDSEPLASRRPRRANAWKSKPEEDDDDYF